MADQINLVSHEKFKEGLKGVYDKTKEKISDLKLRTHVGKELDYGSFGFSENYLTNSEFIYFNTIKNGNIVLDKSDNTIILEPYKKYLIDFGIRSDGTLVLQYCLYDKATNSKLGSNVLTTQAGQSGVNPCMSIIETKDKNIKLCIQRVYNIGSGIIYGNNSFMNIIEIGREVLINEVEEVDKKHGIQDTPVGHIMSVMSLTAPAHYLLCDGKEYNIEDYPKLAEYFQTQFGSINYFGGDGTDTFSVPDMRGEFVRGYDKEKKRDPEGSTRGIGKHQDATKILNVSSNYNLDIIYPYNVSTSNFDSSINSGGLSASPDNWNTKSGGTLITTRPTNVNVLFCIKYEPTYFMNYSPQYAGFDSKTLFDGEAKDSGKEYLLNDKVENYDYLDVYCTLREKTNKELLCGSYIKINCENIKKGITRHELSISNDGVPWRYNVEIKESSFVVNINSVPNNVYDMFVYSIVGVKSGSNSLINKNVTNEMISNDISDIFSEVMDK